MTAMGWKIAVERLGKGARSGGASSSLSAALSLSFGALLLALALASPRPPDASSDEPPTPTEQAAAKPPDVPIPSLDAMQPTESFALGRIVLPPPPAPCAAAARPESKAPPREIVTPQRAQPASERASALRKRVPATPPPPSQTVAARPALAPPSPSPATRPPAKTALPAERLPELAKKRPAEPIKALVAQTEPVRPAPMRDELAERRAASLDEKTSAIPTDMAATPDPAAPSTLAPATPAPAPPSVAIRVGDKAAPEAVAGRALLQILEHGSGPGIVIAWPGEASERSALYSLLTRCYGVHTALLDSAGNLYRADQAGAWAPNTDRYSSFLRQVEGRLPAGERSAVEAIRRRHPGTRGSSTVRLFPRNVDAVLLGGLRGIVGDHYREASRINARYARSGQSVVVEDIRIDGAALPGRVALTPPRYCPAARSS
jgi:hypothetical protein